MDPREFLRLANDLLDATIPDACACRTAIGRSYYAAFNVALSMLDELNISLDKDENAHLRLTQILDSSDNPTLKSVGASLGNQKGYRRIADYKMGDASVETTQKAGMVLLLAKRAVEQLDRIRSDASQWSAASRKMRDFARSTLRKNV